MERELKFRAWDGKRMIYFQDLMIGIDKRSNNPYVFFQTDTFGGEVRLGKHEVMQYSGLTDKNGREIYEGDVVRFFDTVIKGNESCTNYDDEIVNGQIIWDDERCGWAITNRISIENEDFFEQLSDEAEIIGNIYENPELITA